MMSDSSVTCIKCGCDNFRIDEIEKETAHHCQVIREYDLIINKFADDINKLQQEIYRLDDMIKIINSPRLCKLCSGLGYTFVYDDISRMKLKCNSCDGKGYEI